MTQINITKFFNEACPKDYSASVAEIGESAGQYTWQAAREDADDYNMLDDDDKRQAFREWVKESGGWNEEEIAAWSDQELNALFIQWVAGDIREAGFDLDKSEEAWKQYQIDCEAGQVSSDIWRDDVGQIWFSLDR